MIPYVVRAGEFLTQIAHARGFDPALVWSHPANRALRERRPDPEMLAPGDILHVPPRAAPASLPVAVGQTNRYRAEVPRVHVRLAIGAGGARVANARYRAVLPGSAEVIAEGTTDGDGFVELVLRPDVSRVRLVFAEIGLHYLVRVGHLDPIEEGSGLRSRLRHLGYLVSAEEDGLRRALRAFQFDHQLPLTGALDDATRAALLAEHGS